MSRGARLVAVAVIAVALFTASGARAAFPGANGLIAVDPPDGHGVLLADARGHVVRRLCPGGRITTPDDPTPRATGCSGISTASWSPSGRELALIQESGGYPWTTIVYADDASCLACALSTGDTAHRPSVIGDPVFAPGDRGLVVSVSGTRVQGLPPSPNTLATETLDGLAYAELALGGDASQPAVAASGRIAFVRSVHRHREVMVAGVAANSQPHRIARGQSPTFSPNGKRIAYANGGSVWVTAVDGGGPRRLVRGSAPAWSPDGRSIAFLGPGSSVRIVKSAGGNSRRLGTLRGRHLDWQPIVRRPPTCAVPPGSTVEAVGPAAVVYSDGGGAWLGCLRGEGELRLIGTRIAHSGIGFQDFRFTGTLVAYEWTHGNDFPPCFPQDGYLIELDLATGTTLTSDHVQSPCFTDPDRETLDEWGLGANGAVVYLTEFGPVPGKPGATTYMITVHDDHGIRQIDSAASSTFPPPLTNFRVTGNTVSWEHDGQPRSAPLGGAP